VVDEVDRLLDGDVLDDVVVHVRERGVAQVLDVPQRGGFQVVEADHAVAALEQRLAEVRPEEARAAGDERGWHRRRC
jgi:hypothetical protein